MLLLNQLFLKSRNLLLSQWAQALCGIIVADQGAKNFLAGVFSNKVGEIELYLLKVYNYMIKHSRAKQAENFWVKKSKNSLKT